MIANLRHKRRFPRIIPKIRLKQKPKIEHIVLETIRMYDESSFIRLVETVEHTYYTYVSCVSLT